MTFTDDDLKRLKDDLAEDKAETKAWHYIWVKQSNLDALLARLEAAEIFIMCLNGEAVVDHINVNDALKAWRKAAGR